MTYQAVGKKRGWRGLETDSEHVQRPVLDSLGKDLDEILEHIDPWSEAIIAAGSSPKRVKGVYNIGGGPHFRLRLDLGEDRFT